MSELVQARVPVTILSGFLAVGVDEKILSEKADEELVEVMNGCICCTVRGDLIKALKNLHSKIADFDAVIIECTGMADPAPVAQTFFVHEEIGKLYELDGLITVVDSMYIRTRLDERKEKGIVNEASQQVAFADRILCNKIDLVNEEDLADIEGRLRAINPTAEIIRCQQSAADPSKLININAFTLERVQEMDAQFLDTERRSKHDPNINSIAFNFEGYLNLFLLQQLIDTIINELGANLYRYKGVLNIAGMSKRYVFQGVGMLFSGNFTTEWTEDECRDCRFVFIGKGLMEEEIRTAFYECECDEELRFKVGDTVSACVGDPDTKDGWAKGTVIKTWDEGNPYRIEIHDEEKRNVWAPVDDNNFCKKQ